LIALNLKRMAEFKGGDADAMRIRMMQVEWISASFGVTIDQVERERQKKEFEQQLNKMREEAAKSLTSIDKVLWERWVFSQTRNLQVTLLALKSSWRQKLLAL
jgi:hypothetical protein